MSQLSDQIGDVAGRRNRRMPIEEYRHHSALFLTSIDNEDRVKTMRYIRGHTRLAEFIPDFVEETKSDRDLGYIIVDVKNKNNDDKFSWVFRKVDVYLVGAIVNGVLYELADRPYSDTRKNRWLEGAKFTGYDERYSSLLGEKKLVGVVLSEEAFTMAADAVFNNPQDPSKWKYSFGVTSLMIAEPARFVPFKDALVQSIANHTPMVLAEEGKGEYDWVPYMTNNWFEFSECSRKFIYPHTERPPPYKLQSMAGYLECLRNPTAAYQALSLKCYVKFLDDPLNPRGPRGGPRGDGGGPRGDAGGPRGDGGGPRGGGRNPPGRGRGRGQPGDRGGPRGGGRNPPGLGRCPGEPGGSRRRRGVTRDVYVSDTSNATSGNLVVHPATLDLRGTLYELLRKNATKCLLDDYGNPGPLQFEGPGADSKAVSLRVEDLDHIGHIEELNDYLDKKRTIVKAGCSQDVLQAVPCHL